MNIADITITIVTSANANITLSKTVINALNALKRAGRASASIQDVAFIINNNVKAKWNKVTEKQVGRVMSEIARRNANGERYTAMIGAITNLDGYFFSL